VGTETLVLWVYLVTVRTPGLMPENGGDSALRVQLRPPGLEKCETIRRADPLDKRDGGMTRTKKKKKRRGELLTLNKTGT